MKLFPTKPFATFTLCVFTATACVARQPGPLSRRAQSIKDKAATLVPGAGISVIPLNGEEEYGTFKTAGQQDFTFYDIDRKTDITLTYTEVKKVKDGYGGYNSVTHRHTDHTRAYIIIGVTAGVLAGLIIAVTTAKN